MFEHGQIGLVSNAYRMRRKRDVTSKHTTEESLGRESFPLRLGPNIRGIVSFGGEAWRPVSPERQPVALRLRDDGCVRVTSDKRATERGGNEVRRLDAGLKGCARPAMLAITGQPICSVFSNFLTRPA